MDNLNLKLVAKERTGKEWLLHDAEQDNDSSIKLTELQWRIAQAIMSIYQLADCVGEHPKYTLAHVGEIIRRQLHDQGIDF